MTKTNVHTPVMSVNNKRSGRVFVLLVAIFVAQYVSIVQGFSAQHYASLQRTSSRNPFHVLPNGGNNHVLKQRRELFRIKSLVNDDTDEAITSVLPAEQIIISSRPKPQQPGHCRFCSQTFPSRNALFRHLTADSKCASLAGNSIDSGPKAPTSFRYEMMFLFGYHDATNRRNDPEVTVASEADRASSLLLEAFEVALGDMVTSKDDTSTVKILSCTQSSIAKMRHKVLSQEPECAGVGDVMIVSWRQNEALSRQEAAEEASFMSRLMDRIQEILDRNQHEGLQVQLQACKWLDDSYHIHAERACTQRVYHYLLPVSWLPDGNDIRDWWLDKTNATGGDSLRFARPHSSKRIHEERHGPNSGMPSPPESLQRFKYLLRQVESVELLDVVSMENDTDSVAANDMVDRNTPKRAAGRFGTMARRERRPWHNYADPSLQGDASPNNEPVWRVVDRARVVQFLTDKSENGNGNTEIHDSSHYDHEDVIAVLEFRGDEFMPQQIRRIIGTLLAVSHGWLPSDMLDVSTSSSQFLETALAPPGRLYLAGLRFHFDEMRTQGKPLFESNTIGTVVARNNARRDDDDSHYPEDLAWIQNNLLQDTRKLKSMESQWLEELQLVVAPRIRQQLEKLTSASLPKESTLGLNLTAARPEVPAEYERTLQLLRDIVESNSWPATTAARSSVILSRDRDDDKTLQVNTGGSFTVLNPSVLDDINYSGKPLPLGNVLFPKLAQAVFDLESKLSENEGTKTSEGISASRRSSHCAINCNAQFTPHVDSGRGAGQSLSMIVGLGNYRGGELAVEGTYHDIQYQPLEFDGWKMRHWTLPFEGERFSLVWFTPHTETMTALPR